MSNGQWPGKEIVQFDPIDKEKIHKNALYSYFLLFLFFCIFHWFYTF